MKSTFVVLLICLIVSLINAQTFTPTPTATPTPTPTAISPAPSGVATTTVAPTSPTNPTSVFGTLMTAAGVVPATTSTATGIFIGLWDGSSTLYYYAMHSVSGSATLTLHDGASATQTAATTYSVSAPANVMTSGTWTLTGTQIYNIYNNLQYVSITVGGSDIIRGTVILFPYPNMFLGFLNNQQVASASSSNAAGLFLGSYSGTTLSANVQWNVTSPTSVVIGTGTGCSTSTPTLTYPTPASGAMSSFNTFSNVNTSTVITPLNANQLYVQVNSAAYPNGEIRGQIQLYSAYTNAKSVKPITNNCQSSSPTSTPSATSKVNFATSNAMVSLAVVFVVMISSVLVL